MLFSGGIMASVSIEQVNREDSMAGNEAGWYPDPSGDPSKMRFWNGAQWTDDCSPADSTGTGRGITRDP